MFDRLREQLQEHRKKNPLDSVATPLLFNVYRKQQRWGDAARIALEELWANPEVLGESSGWLRALKSVAAADPLISKAVERPTDWALLTLVAATRRRARSRKILARWEQEDTGSRGRGGPDDGVPPGGSTAIH